MNNDKKIPTVGIDTGEETEHFAGGISMRVVSKDSDLGKFLSSLVEDGERKSTTGIVLEPTEEQAKQLLKLLEQSRVPRPEHQPLRHPILEAMRARAEAGQYGHSEQSTRYSTPQLLGRGQPEPDIADLLIERFMNDLTGGCGDCTGCDDEPTDVEATLTMAGHLEEGIDLLKLGIKEGMLDEATEDERLALANRFTKMRRKLAKLEGKLRA